MSEFRRKFRRVVIIVPRMDQLIRNDAPFSIRGKGKS